MVSVVGSALRYRWLLYELVVRDITLRYRGSLFGFAWTLLNPLLFMAIYTLVFSVYLRSNIHDFPLYLLAGMVPWLWMSSAVAQAVTSLYDGRTYIGKTMMPTELLVIVPVLSNGVNFLITMVLVILVSLFFGVNIAWALLFLPLLILIELLMTLGISFFVATANVFYRDLQQLVGYAIMAVFFLTPLFYARDVVPQRLQWLVTFSPIAALVSCYQAVLYYGTPPHWRELIFALVFGCVVFIASMLYFNRHRDTFAEYV